MKYLFSILIYILAFNICSSNDASLLSQGSVIYPRVETDISLEKEILSFNCTNDTAIVNVKFTFFNPDSNNKKLKLGFYTPSPDGETDFYLNPVPRIYDFKVQANGNLLPYELKASECIDCELKDTSDINYKEINNYIYLFEINFSPGYNEIHHSYRFPASADVLTSAIYYYTLSTGTKWKGEKIKDFRLQINIGENKYFYVDDIYGENAEWNIIGTGKITDKYYKNRKRFVRILSGFLEINVKNFKPKEELEFGIMYGQSFESPLFEDNQLSEKNRVALVNYTIDPKDDNYENYTLEDLKILRNAIYAQHGYDFENKELKNYFQKFEWYIPDPNLDIKDTELTKREKRFLKDILEYEKKLRRD